MQGRSRGPRYFIGLLAILFILSLLPVFGCDESICDECRVVSSGDDCKSDETAGACCCKNGKNVSFCCPRGTSTSGVSGCGFCN